MIRLGFPVRVVGRPELRAADRRGPAPHLSVSLIYLRDILGYLARIGVRFYRLAPDLAPPGAVAAHLGECRAELAAIAAQVCAQGVRLALHLDHTVALGVPDDTLAARGLAAAEEQAALLEQLDSARPGSAMMVAHVGGPAEGASLERFAARYAALSPRARARLAVEHDGAGFSLGQLLLLHQRCGVPIVFDYLHWQLLNPEGLPLDLALGLALATWPPGIRPEVHLSTGRTEAHLLPGAGGQPPRVLAPPPGQHADFIAPADLLALLRASRGLPPFDLMIEAKAGDLALLRARADLARLAPALAAGLA